MEQAIPIQTLHLFPVLDKLLLELLASLSPEEWHMPTVASLWNVKDVAAHLLDGNVRAIAALNGYQNNEPPPQIDTYQDLVAYLNELNAAWVKAMKRVSPELLIAQLENTGKQYIQYLHTLPPFASAMYSVAWAGEDTSLNWFHIAREYTEKWHHQQQIRDAVGRSGLMTKELFYPAVATFMYALPHTYRNTFADEGTVLKITVTGDAGGEWYLMRLTDKWVLRQDLQVYQTQASVILAPDTAWKLFTKAITPDAAHAVTIIKGDTELAVPLFRMLAVMA
ncbi:maleylpyruvate isomerase N-terminal domain-containing protein [Mucilaginibacter psychrotolerans]|uniref:Mycothiol-dependent maleylpyruvate isomerase metal-binding domain-containing protein n=1 Tax=Mucilaginibacter psychrotolerans TaxID=1524096 RepID=A0A4Y8SMH6_9SPHI|nr:maleylpyruvate isomerase N-terminal domain-containing protein [Mucilaginibacter psychrotolerans]TFF39664.1 hypothetical protein E2R66_04670 [Mucilaginibacter psychrotolerans]